MIRPLVILLAASVAFVAYEKPAEACGVKLTIKSPRVRRAARSPNPSRILLLGDPPRSLARDLSRKGHSVDVASSADETSRRDYDVVVADQNKVAEAEQNFPNSRVVTRAGSNKSAVARVESSLARKPTRMARRAPVRSREERLPIRVGGSDAEDAPEVVAAAETQPEPIATEPEPMPTAEPEPEPVAEPEPEREVVAMNTNTAREREPRDVNPQPKRANKSPRFTDVVFFRVNQYQLNGKNRRLLRRDAKWLEANPDASITVAGHTDATGAAQYNLMLSERRANAVRDFLVSQGVDPSRIEVVSFGEERPAYNSGRDRRVEINR